MTQNDTPGRNGMPTTPAGNPSEPGTTVEVARRLSVRPGQRVAGPARPTTAAQRPGMSEKERA